MREIDKERIVQIKQMLLALTEGDFSFQIERTNQNDEIESLIVMLNWVVEEMQETLKLYSVLNTRTSNTQVVHLVYLLDSDFKIAAVNRPVTVRLHKSKESIIGSSFVSLLNNTSTEQWKKITQNLLSDDTYNDTHLLQFKDTTKLVKSHLCSVLSLKNPQINLQYYLVTSIETEVKSKILDEEIILKKRKFESKQTRVNHKPSLITKEKDVRALQEVRDFILKHLEEPLPSLKVLANKYGINEYKLKSGFNQLYHTSVFRFLTEERLKRGCILIENTELPLQMVTKLSGFKNVSHFSSAFKKRYGIKPSAYRKYHRENNN